MIEAERTVLAQHPSGERTAVTITFIQQASDFAANEDGSTSEIFRAMVRVSSEHLNAHIPVAAEDVFVLMCRAMWLTNEVIANQALRLGWDVFQQEPGDAAGPLGLFSI